MINTNCMTEASPLDTRNEVNRELDTVHTDASYIHAMKGWLNEYKLTTS